MHASIQLKYDLKPLLLIKYFTLINQTEYAKEPVKTSIPKGFILGVKTLQLFKSLAIIASSLRTQTFMLNILYSMACINHHSSLLVL